MDTNAVLHIRRHQPTRLEGFVDASFAFAVTLLVISIGRVPTKVADMLHALRGVPAFALCFLVIARIWKSHRDWSRYYDLDDPRALVLSLLLVFVVLVFVYPLRLLFALFFAWVSHGYLVDQPVTASAEDLRAAFIVYGVGFAAIAALFALLYRHALGCAAAIGLDAREVIATRMHVVIWAAFVLLAIASLLCAALLPFRNDQPLVYTIPGMIYAVSGPVAALVRRRYARRLAAPGSAA